MSKDDVAEIGLLFGFVILILLTVGMFGVCSLSPSAATSLNGSATLITGIVHDNIAEYCTEMTGIIMSPMWIFLFTASFIITRKKVKVS